MQLLLCLNGMVESGKPIRHSNMAAELLNLNGKHVVITGASSGLGEALALEFATHGARLTLLARRQEMLDKVAEQVRSGGGEAIAISTDVTDQTSVDAAITQAVEQCGPVDVLVANAGASRNMSVSKMDVPLVTDAMQLNFFGVVYPMNAVLPSMIARRDGVVLAISSVAAFRGLPTMAPYCASKSAVSAWMESLRSELDLQESGVQLIISHPGYIKTPMTETEETNMPFLVEVDDAARTLVDGIRRGESEINFPWQLISMMKFAGRLPNRLYDRVVWGSATNPVTWGIAARDACLWVLGGVVLCLLAWYSLRQVSASTAQTLSTAYRFGFPVLGLAALVLSKRLRKSIKVPIVIVVFSVPLAIIAGLVQWLG